MKCNGLAGMHLTGLSLILVYLGTFDCSLHMSSATRGPAASLWVVSSPPGACIRMNNDLYPASICHLLTK